ncbi:mucin-5AC-like isoform X1 [Syngnathus typhle]|uniref:mucin-5AC-like isoform X1 n=2 Tax=Syngnathus typhle TaxID=161592 RepID=UPI002A6AB71D|nr:mucin-5AC-like isoform X1 [Syngnathus typhle]
MSTDHFQTKYASFMEVLVKSTITETTKLFETVVDELKAEISKLKAENEALKRTNRQKAEARSFAITVPGQRSRSTMHDSAVQCDLGQLFLLVEPVGQILNDQGKECNEEETVYLLLNDDGAAAKEGNPSRKTVSLSNHKDSEAVLCAVADPPAASARGNETNGPEMDRQCLNEELRRSHGTQMTKVYPGPEVDHSSRALQKDSMEGVNDLNLVATTKDKMEVVANTGQILAGLGSRESEEFQKKLPSLGEQNTLLDQPPEEEQIRCLTEDKTKCDAQEQVNQNRRKRKQPSDKVKHLPKFPTETLLLPSAGAASHDGVENSSLSPTASSPPPGVRESSAMLQDAMLLVEAMDQSKNRTPTGENRDQRTLDGSDEGAREEPANQTLCDTCPTESSDCQSPTSVRSRQPKLASSDVTLTSTDTASKSPEQCSPGVLTEAVEITAGSGLVPKKIFVFSKSPSTHPQGTIAPLSPNQISAVVSTVAAAKNKPPSESSQRKDDGNSTTAAPLVTSKPTSGSTEKSSASTVCKKITIIIRRAADVAASPPQLSEAQVAPTNQNPVEPVVVMSSPQNAGVPVTLDDKETPSLSDQTSYFFSRLPSPQPSEPTSVCKSPEKTPAEQSPASPLSQPTDVGENLEQMATLSSEGATINCPSPSPQPEPSSQPTGIYESSQRPAGEESAASSSAAATASGPSESLPLVPVISLKKLSDLEVSTGSVLLSQLLPHQRESEVVPPDSSEQASQTPICPSASSTAVAETSNVSETLPCSTLKEAPDLEKTIVDFNTVDFPTVCDRLCQSLCLDEDVVTAAKFPVILKDRCDPHLQMSKTQFLAQLSVTPVIQNAQKMLTSESADAQGSCEETSTDHRTKPQRMSFLARLGIHLRTRSQAKGAETNPQPLREKMYSAKKPRLENVSTNEQGSSHEPIPGPERDFCQVSPDINYPHSLTTFEPVSVIPRKPIVNLCRLALKDATDGVAIVERNLRPTTKHALDSLKSGHTIECDSINSIAENSASKPSESGPRSNSTTADLTTAKLALLRDCTSNHVVSGDSSLSPGSALPQDEPGARHPAAITTEPSASRDTESSKKSGAATKAISGPLMSKFPAENRKSSVGPTACALNPNDPRPSTCDPLGGCDFSKGEETSKLDESNWSLRKTPQMPKWVQSAGASNKTGESIGNEPRLNLKSPVQENNTKMQNSKAARAKHVLKDAQTKVQRAKQLMNHRSGGTAENKPLCPSPKVRVSKSVHVRGPTVVAPAQPRSVVGKKLLKNQCEECGRVLSSGAALESHLSLHTGHRPFCCTHCGKSFPDAKGLKRHGIVHRNGRLHICQQCGKGFVYGFGLNKHLQMVHGKHKPFVCQLCNKAFFTKRDVEIHIRTHTGEKPFHCHLCEKRFVRSVELNAHLRWHSGEKRHWCPYCGKGFFDQNNLKRHKYIHTGEKPHSCPYCPKHFTQSGHLKKHVKNVHKVQ